MLYLRLASSASVALPSHLLGDLEPFLTGLLDNLRRFGLSLGDLLGDLLLSLERDLERDLRGLRLSLNGERLIGERLRGGDLPLNPRGDSGRRLGGDLPLK